MADALTTTRPKPSRLSRLRSRTFTALENPNYRRFYAGHGVSLVGTWVQTAAVNWLVFEMTRSEFMLGVVEAAGVMPGLLVGLIAGALADRVRPRAMVLAMQIGQMLLAVLLAVLVGTGVATVWHLALILALARICVTFEMPSRQVFLYNVVGRGSLMNAIALNSGLFNASRIVGPAIAGLLLVRFGATSCFALNAISYLAAIAALLSIRLDPGPVATDEPGRRPTDDLLGGIAYLRQNRRVAALFGMLAFLGVAGMGYIALVPAYAQRVVDTGAGGYSLLLASSGVGATIGALVVASLGHLPRKEKLVVRGMGTFAVALGAAGALPLAITRAGMPEAALLVAAICLFGVGFGGIMFFSSTQTLIQTTVPDHLRGRVMGIWMIVYSGSVPLGALWAGRFAQSFGVGLVMVLSAGLCLIAALIVGASGILCKTAPTDHSPQA